MNRQILVFLLALLMVAALALPACGKGDGSGGGLGDVSVGAPDPEDGPSAPPAASEEKDDFADPVQEPAASGYSVNSKLLSYIGKSPDEIKGLLGDYDDTMWYTGVIFQYGDIWVAFDGSSEEPAGDLSFILCGLADLVNGLDSDVSTAELDGVFGSQGVYSANEENGNEWFSGGFVTYRYQGFKIDIGCSPDMSVKADGSALIWGNK